MRALRRASRLAAVLLLCFTGLTCRDMAGPTGTGRVAPTNAALAFSSVLPEETGDPIIPIRQARVRLYRLPGQIPERAVLDTVLPFLETDSDRAVTLKITLTMASERFGIEVALLDDRAQVAYLGRDTVIAYTSGPPPNAKQLLLRYAGPDTLVARIALAPRDTVLAIGDLLSLRPTAFLRDGVVTGARFGFAVHGTSAISVDRSGTLRASGPVAPGTAWVVSRIATGLADSVGVSAIVPAKSITITPASGRMLVGKTVALAAVPRDSTGAPLGGRAVVWSSSDPNVASVSNGAVAGAGVGTAVITASSERASASASITVLPAGIARVVPSTDLLVLDPGQSATISALARDAADDEMAGRTVSWSVANPGVAIVSAATSLTATDVTVLGVTPGFTSLKVRVDSVEATVAIRVRRLPAARVSIAPRSASLLVGETVGLSAVARDATGAAVTGSPITWRSLGPATASVDAGGVVRGLAAGHAEVVASIDGVSDTVAVDVAQLLATLSVLRVSTVFSERGDIATFVATITTQAGPIASALPTWRIDGSATILDNFGLSVRVLLPPGEQSALIVSYGGITVSVPLVGAGANTEHGSQP